MRLRSRVEAMEARQPNTALGKPFLWGEGQPLAEALADAGLTLEDKPLLAIRLVAPAPGGGVAYDPIYERDAVLLE